LLRKIRSTAHRAIRLRIRKNAIISTITAGISGNVTLFNTSILGLLYPLLSLSDYPVAVGNNRLEHFLVAQPQTIQFYLILYPLHPDECGVSEGHRLASCLSSHIQSPLRICSEGVAPVRY